MAQLNQYGQAVGSTLVDWVPRSRPPVAPIEGRRCRLEKLAPIHADALYTACSSAADGRDWTYMTVGPFASRDEFDLYIDAASRSEDPLHFAVIDLSTNQAVGTLALMRIDARNGVIEVGSVTFSPLLKQSCISTETQYLLMRRVFDELGYRRYEWKCDSLNEPSRVAAARLGFTYEGLFRQAVVYKARSRDTAWFSIVDHEWPTIRAAFEAWLALENFDEFGRQRRSLVEIRQILTEHGKGQD